MTLTQNEDADDTGGLVPEMRHRDNRFTPTPDGATPLFGQESTPPPTDLSSSTTRTTAVPAANAAPGQTLPAENNGGAGGTVSDEVSFITGVNPDGTLALYSFQAWNQPSNPADYSGGYTLATKWAADASDDTAGTPGGTVTYAFDPSSNWTSTEQAAFKAGLALWSAVANVSFSLTSNYQNANIEITRGHDGQADTQILDATGAPNVAARTGGTALLQLQQVQISIDTSVAGFGPIQPMTSTPNNIFTNFGGYAMQTILHEEGHALGLGHAGPYPVTGTPADALQYSAYDSRQWTIMSYIDPSDTSALHYASNPVPGTNWGAGPNFSTDGHAYYDTTTTMMPLDMLAVQQLYGAPVSTPLAGGQTFGSNIANIPSLISPFYDPSINLYEIETIWDGGTGNTLDLHGVAGTGTINLNPGTFSSFNGRTNNLAIAYNTKIDKLLANGGTIIGNDDGDYIDGGAAAVTIYGGAGNDTLLGGSGKHNDLIYGGAGINSIDGEDDGTGSDGGDTAGYTLAKSNYTFAANPDGSITVTGGGAIDTLKKIEFLKFADQTIAISAALPQTITGGPGNDNLLATRWDDTFDGGGGTNTVSYANATAAVAVDLSLSGPQATGGSGNDSFTNIQGIIGSSYNDILRGTATTKFISGGAGSDQIYDDGSGTTIDGGSGSDSLGNVYVDTLTLDRSTMTTPFTGTFTPGSATAQIFSDGTTVANIETLVLTTGSGDDDVKFVGVYGNVTQSWNGGSGNDTAEIDLSGTNLGTASFVGGVYRVGGAVPSEGYIDFTNVENFIIHAGAGGSATRAVMTGGAGNDTFYGSTSGDKLNGAAGNDSLYGLGGNDTLTGGTGNNYLDGGDGIDTAVVGGTMASFTVTYQANGDVVVSGSGETDTLHNVEKVSFTDQTITLGNAIIGTSGDDLLLATAANDIIDGGGGNDTLSYANATAGVTVNLAISGPQATGGSGSDQLVNVGNLIGSPYNDTLTGDGGNNTINGGAGDDVLDGSGGINTISFTGAGTGVTASLASGTASGAGTGNDTFVRFQNIIGGDGNDSLTGDSSDNTVSGGAGNDILRGNGGVNILDGGVGNDTAAFALSPGSFYLTANSDGSYTVQGPGETDTLMNIENVSFDGTGQILTLTQFQVQSLDPYEYVASNPDLLAAGFGNNPSAAAQHYVLHGYYEGRSTNSFDSYEYVASNPDLLAAGFGNNLRAAVQHYVLHGYSEGRSTGSFDPYEYVASNSDLLAAGFGNNLGAAVQHYVLHGYSEGRSTGSFDPYEYVASNSDLLAAGFGNNPNVAEQHYVLHGYQEGRSATSFDVFAYVASNPDLLAAGLGNNPDAAARQYVLQGYAQVRSTSNFDPYEYVASNPDLLVAGFGNETQSASRHYVLHGYLEGRATNSFDPYQYVASNPDLLAAGFGGNPSAAAQHYVLHGYYEGRSTNGFDPYEYVASNPDLLASGFGGNSIAASQHYVLHGYYEGRSTNSFDGVAYLLTNDDLAAAGIGVSNAVRHYVLHGYAEGRSASGNFGTEQTNHALVLGIGQNNVIGTSGDEDWFSVSLAAGQSYTFTLSGADGGGGTLPDPFLEIHAGNGVLLAQDGNGGHGNDSIVHMTASSNGTYYLVAYTNVGLTGSYNILAAVG